MMTRPATNRRPATYQDILDAPPNLVAELLDGELSLQPRPPNRHTLAKGELLYELKGAFDRGTTGPGGWIILTEPEIHFSQSRILVPDLAGWRRTTMAAVADTAFIDVAPDWVCEVLSPSTRRYDLTAKRDIYAAHGVGHLWFVDPIARVLEAFELRDGQWALGGALHGAVDVALPPFDAAPFALAALWPHEPEET